MLIALLLLNLNCTISKLSPMTSKNCRCLLSSPMFLAVSTSISVMYPANALVKRRHSLLDYKSSCKATLGTIFSKLGLIQLLISSITSFVPLPLNISTNPIQSPPTIATCSPDSVP